MSFSSLPQGGDLQTYFERGTAHLLAARGARCGEFATLRLVVMDELPSRGCDLLQRLGRVGRVSDRPGLAVLCLGFSPGDERLVEEPVEAFSVTNMKSLPLPRDLETVWRKTTFAAFHEWMGASEKPRPSGTISTRRSPIDKLGARDQRNLI